MKGLLSGLVLLGLAVSLLASARLTLEAQPRSPVPLPVLNERDRQAGETDNDRDKDQDEAPALSVQDALQRPFSFPFAEPTTLTEVGQYLRRALRAPVVLDLAALERQEVRPDDRVQLQLEGVRLKTGLKLLLDQVALTFHVIPEDNLLVVTDTEGSSEPIDRVLSELKALHRDMHDLQDTVDNIVSTLGGDEGGARMHKPTIIEELPGEAKPGEKPEPPPSNSSGDRSRTRSRPGA